MKVKFFKKAQEIKEAKTRLDFIKELGYDGSHGYSMLRSSKTLKEHEYLMNLSQEYDNYGYMSQQLGEELDSMFEDKDYVIGIHRTGYTSIDNNILNDIFNNGLINNGHVMYGGNTGQHDIEKTVSIFYDFAVLNGQLKAAHKYKNSEGCIIVKIPKSYLGKSDGEIKPIYKQNNGISRLLPEFVYGYIPVNNSVLGEMVHNPKYKDIHTYSNNDLYYDDAAYYKAKREGIDLYQVKTLSLNDKYFMLEKAYRDTLMKYGEYQAEQALIRLINSGETQYFSGNDNRVNISQNISKDEVLKILAFASNSQNNDINYLITNFQKQIIDSVYGSADKLNLK